jgi:outer membrane usher protein FimD/PapC
MLPPDLRGYAPQITGVAQTNAKVTVSQNNRIIYQENVPPGPFSITNLFNTLQGQLDVKVEEEDGRVTQWQVASNSIPYLTRKGQIRYTTAMGKPTSVGGDSLQQPFFWTGEFSWGWLNNVSLYGGSVLTNRDYQSLATGVGLTLTRWAHYPLMSRDLMLSYIIRIKKRVIATVLTIQNVLNLPVASSLSLATVSLIKTLCR